MLIPIDPLPYMIIYQCDKTVKCEMIIHQTEYSVPHHFNVI